LRLLTFLTQELEALAETGAISDEQYDTIMNALPAESALSGTSRTTAQASPPPAASFTNLSLNNNSPPAYGNASPPSLPGRENPSRPELTRANALYRYAEPGDCNFEVGDQIAVYEYMNADWWLGKNLRTGQEGVFPVNYVQPQANPPPPPRPGLNSPPSQGPYYGSDKAGTSYGGGYPAQPQQYQDPPPPAPSDPYNSAIPPMQMANQPVEQRPSKGAEMGKKFGKKLGNAAIFGAGATIGSDIVNSIF
jgi:LAS seventeen-binding protein 1/2